MSYSDNNSFEQIMERMLSNPKLAELDKREGSIIYDSFAPTAMELADAYAKIDVLEEQTYLMTATGKNLDKRVYDYGIKRIQATKSKRIGTFKGYKLDAEGNPEKDEHGNKILIDMEIPIGTRFAVPSEKTEITYIYTGKKDTNNILECEQYGTIGNSHLGIILPLNPIPNLVESKLTGTLQPANDEETDMSLRERTTSSINRRSFGGNIPAYVEEIKNIDGAGNCKVFPAWQYNGSVLLSVVDSQYNPATDEFCKLIKQKLDPEEVTGQGVGIAPIGHYVTVTHPVKKYVKVSIKIELEEGSSIGTVREAINNEIEKYFNSERHRFKQDTNLAIYKARITDVVLNVKEVLNVSSVTLNDANEDIIYKDEASIGTQYLPYVQEVVIG